MDGKKVEIQQINTAYSGVNVIGEGKHKIEIRYHPVGFYIGAILFILGLIGSIFAGVLHKKYKNMQG